MKLASYKGTRRGFKGLLNRAIRWWTNSIYSHNELVFEEFTDNQGNVLCASSSASDGGVRFKYIYLEPSKWDIVHLDMPKERSQKAFQWFADHNEDGYDYLGLFGFIWRREQDKNKWFCNEAIGAALGISNPNWYSPGHFHGMLKENYEVSK